MASLIPQSASSLLLPGDRIEQRVALEEGAAAHVTSQGAQAVHGAPAGEPAGSHWQIALARDCLLELILDPLILFPNSALHQSFDVALEKGSCLLISDGMTWHPDPAAPAFRFMESAFVLRDSGGGLRLREKARSTPEQFLTMAQLYRRAPVACGQFYLLFGEAAPPDLEVEIEEEASAYLAASRLPDRAGFLVRFLCFEPAAFARVQRGLWRQLRLALTGKLPPDRRKSR